MSPGASNSNALVPSRLMDGASVSVLMPHSVCCSQRSRWWMSTPPAAKPASAHDLPVQRQVGGDAADPHLVQRRRMRTSASSRVAPCTISLAIIES